MEPDKQSIRNWIIKNLFSLAAIGVAIVNLWLAYRLSPIVSDLKDFGSRINAVESQLDSHQDDSKRVIESIDTKLDQVKEGISDIKSRVSRIEGKLEK
jgi:hypothetical protein